MKKFATLARVVAAASMLNVASCMTHPWFKSRLPWQDPPDENQQPVLTNAAGEHYHPGTPSWIPLIDDCIRAGGNRSDCIDKLPPEELAKLEQWEQERSRRDLRDMGTTTGMGYERVPDHRTDPDDQ